MKTRLCFLAATAVAALASAAGAADQPTITLTHEAIEGGYTPRLTPSVVYSSIPGPYAAFPAASGSLGFDDYNSVATTNPTFTLAQLRFVGGVTAVGQQLRFEFFDAQSNPFSNFTVTFGQAGNFIWTITLGTAALNGKDSTFQVPTIGEIEIFAVGAATGQFFLTPTPAAPGSSSLAVGGAAGTHNHAFELRQVPAPGALALLGLGGLITARRRR